MVVSEPFTVAYALGLLENALIIDIGAGTMDLCVMHGTIPLAEDQRSLSQAGDFIDEQLHQHLRSRFPEAGMSRNMVRRFKEAHAFVGPPPRPVRVTVPCAGRPTELDITAEMRAACEALLPYVAEALRAAIAGVDPEFQEPVRQNVVLAGGTAHIRGLDRFVEDILGPMGGGKVTVVDDSLFTGASGALSIALDTPSEDWGRLRSEPDLVL
jgi:rod shape-determining protein MreB